jgi:hypothetical protein
MDMEKKIETAKLLIIRHGGHDEAHHKAWCLDQVFRILAGDDYEDIVNLYIGEGHEWDEGIPP